MQSSLSMAFPVEVTFRDVPRSPAVEASVQRWSKRLAHVYERVERCSVVIERPHRHHRTGQLYDVRIELAVPNRIIAVTHDPGIDGAHEDVHVAVADAFRAARRQLQDHARIVRGD